MQDPFAEGALAFDRTGAGDHRPLTASCPKTRSSEADRKLDGIRTPAGAGLDGSFVAKSLRSGLKPICVSPFSLPLR